MRRYSIGASRPSMRRRISRSAIATISSPLSSKWACRTKFCGTFDHFSANVCWGSLHLTSAAQCVRFSVRGCKICLTASGHRGGHFRCRSRGHASSRVAKAGQKCAGREPGVGIRGTVREQRTNATQMSETTLRLQGLERPMKRRFDDARECGLHENVNSPRKRRLFEQNTGVLGRSKSRHVARGEMSCVSGDESQRDCSDVEQVFAYQLACATSPKRKRGTRRQQRANHMTPHPSLALRAGDCTAIRPCAAKRPPGTTGGAILKWRVPHFTRRVAWPRS